MNTKNICIVLTTRNNEKRDQYGKIINYEVLGNYAGNYVDNENDANDATDMRIVTKTGDIDILVLFYNRTRCILNMDMVGYDQYHCKKLPDLIIEDRNRDTKAIAEIYKLLIYSGVTMIAGKFVRSPEHGNEYNESDNESNYHGIKIQPTGLWLNDYCDSEMTTSDYLNTNSIRDSLPKGIDYDEVMKLIFTEQELSDSFDKRKIKRGHAC